MILYAIVSRDQVSTHGCDVSLEKSCQEKGIEYRRLIVEDVVLDDLRTMEIPEGSLLYRVKLGDKAKAIESLLITLHGNKLTTIYEPKTVNYNKRVAYGEIPLQLKEGLSVIPTAFVDESWGRMSTDELIKRVESLDGFPVIFKTLGLSHGQGVERVEGLERLQSLIKEKSDIRFGTILRKYLADYRHYRLIIVADTVAAVIEYHKPEDDFRTNASSEPEVSAVSVESLSSEISELARRAVELRASILGGVDILVDQETDTAYLAEVNVPCYFARAEIPTGTDVAGILIDAMLRKRDRAQ